MLNRWIGIVSAVGMILAIAAIIARDILPRWLPDDAPPSEAQILRENEARYVQVGISDDEGRTIGRSWTFSRCNIAGVVTVSTTTVLEPLALPNGITTPRVRIETLITYRYNLRRVDELDFRMYGLGLPVMLRGEAYSTGEFPCKWQVGPQRGSFLLDSQAPAALGDMIRPFDRLPNLYVGQTWRLRLLDPLSQILPQLKQSGLDLEPVVITVTGTELIEHQGEKVAAFVVEGGGATAWVAPDGRVLRQEVTVPLLGELNLLLEATCACADPQGCDHCAEIIESRRRAIQSVSTGGRQESG